MSIVTHSYQIFDCIHTYTLLHIGIQGVLEGQYNKKASNKRRLVERYLEKRGPVERHKDKSIDCIHTLTKVYIQGV